MGKPQNFATTSYRHHDQEEGNLERAFRHIIVFDKSIEFVCVPITENCVPITESKHFKIVT